jgi:glutathione S-transferase
MHAQGIWRHSRADILELMDEGIAALAALLADKHFFTGAQPCVADAAAFAFLDKCAPVEPRMHAACMVKCREAALPPTACNLTARRSGMLQQCEDMF